MVERRKSTRPSEAGSARSRPRVRRPRAGRPPGGESEFKRVARAQARLAGSGMLPDELLRMWADTGYMEYATPAGKKQRVQLEPRDRIACARGSAAWYKAPMQPRPAPGEQPPVVRVELDRRTVSALARDAPDKLELLRDVLRAVQAGGGDLSQVASMTGGGSTGAERYGRMLSETSETQGRA